MNSGRTENTYWSIKRQEIISCLCCVLMVAGLLFARGLLSVSMIVFFLNALHPQKIKENWIQFKQSRFAVLSVIFIAVYLLSGLWSGDKGSWWTTIQIKLPFLFLPFAMLDLPLNKPGLLKKVMACILIILFAGMMYSFSFLYYAEYRTGEHLPAPLEGDYIRFTIALVLSLLFVIYLYYNKAQYSLSKVQQRLMLLWSIVAILYIHIQAAKSGLLSFYLLLGIFILHSFAKRKYALLLIGGACIAVIIGGFALSKLPSVQKQISDFEYEKKVWQSHDTAGYNSSYSFVPRLISYEIAGTIISDHPVAGVGAGDVMPEIERQYSVKYPSIVEKGRILPHNQFICTALAVGIPSGLLLLALTLTPLFVKKYRSIYMIATTAIMIFGMMIEPMLEVQFGVFVYLLFTLFWMKVPATSTPAGKGRAKQ